MKIQILILFLITFTNGFSQTEDLNIDKISEKLCRNWVLKEMKSKGEVMEIDLRIEVLFIKDKTMEMITNGQKEKTNWKIIQNRNDFIIVTKNKEKSKLISIDDDSFIITKDYQLELNNPKKESITYYFEIKK